MTSRRNIEYRSTLKITEFMCYLSKLLVVHGDLIIEEIKFENKDISDLTITADKDNISIYEG